jgi:hypothetical protein
MFLFGFGLCTSKCNWPGIIVRILRPDPDPSTKKQKKFCCILVLICTFRYEFMLYVYAVLHCLCRRTKSTKSMLVQRSIWELSVFAACGVHMYSVCSPCARCVLCLCECCPWFICMLTGYAYAVCDPCNWLPVRMMSVVHMFAVWESMCMLSVVHVSGYLRV